MYQGRFLDEFWGFSSKELIVLSAWLRAANKKGNINMCITQLNNSGKHRLFFTISGVLLMACGSAFAAPPANDDCVNAEVLPGAAPFPPHNTSVDATDATFDSTDPLLSCNAGGGGDGNQTVWYQYTPVASGLVDFNTLGSTRADGNELDTAHGAYTGSCGALVQVACVDVGLTDHLNMEVEAGTTYHIKVGQFADASDAGTVVLNVEAGVPPKVPASLILA